MLIEVKVPALPESVADATIATWDKQLGDYIARDENIVDLETDKVVLEVPATAAGKLVEILFQTGATVCSNQVLARIDTDAKAEVKEVIIEETVVEPTSDVAATSPVVRRLLAEHKLEPYAIPRASKDSRVTKTDVLNFIENRCVAMNSEANDMAIDARAEHRVPMSRLRAKVAERLVQAQQQAAMLTTFNEVNLKAVMDLRAQYKDIFEKKHGIKLGFMSFFTKAVVAALKRFPVVNASIDGQDIVYHQYYDIGIAVSTDRGLVVPVIRNAEQLSLAEIEHTINDAATRARAGKLSLEEMQGGTFTITNGGVFGSLLSMPIINPPQTGILGMHKIEERPVVEKGEIVIRPMMYLALSYDHRLIDSKDSVQFLVSIKELLEDPARLLLNV